MKLTEIAADALKGNRTLRCTDRAYDKLRGMYGTDRAVFTAAAALRRLGAADGEIALRQLAYAHNINADA